jgi:hypothetical protein
VISSNIFSYGKTIAFTLIIFFIGVNTVSAQSDEIEFKKPAEGNKQIITLSDGSKIIGEIVEINPDNIIFNSDAGELKLSKNKIVELKEIQEESIKEGAYWFENPNTTRLYFAPTGRMLKKGQGYFSDYYVIFPGFAYGLSDNFTIGGGMSLAPGVDLDEQVYFVTPKIGIAAKEDLNIAAGALILAVPGVDFLDDVPLFGILYGVSTWGGLDGSLTAGLGFGFADDELADNPMVMVGGEKRISRRVSFVSENWLFPGADQPLVSYGIRFFGEGLSVDLAMLTALGEDFFFPGFPWIDFVINF